MPAYLKIEGEVQGLITAGATTHDSIGNERQIGHEDQIIVQALDHTVTIPRDPQSGQPTGTRLHRPVTFTCTLNKAVPLLYNAMVTGEILPTLELQWFRTEGTEQVNFFTTAWEDGLIIDMRTRMPHCQDPANEQYTQLIDVSFSYRKIMWDHVTAGTSASDDWREPVQG